MWKLLQQEQPVFTKIFTHEMEQEKRSHAYLLVGEYLTMEAALFMAASFNCEHSPLACETCSRCKRIFAGNFADCIVLDGRSTSIKKDDILSIQKRFAISSVESDSQKVYILQGVEYAVPEAMNALLKFLEEPEGQGSIGILLADRMDNVLPTIVSRCQVFRFNDAQSSLLYTQCVEAGNDLEESYFLSQFNHTLSGCQEMAEDEDFKSAIGICREFTKQLVFSAPLATVYLQLQTAKGGELTRERFTLFMEMLILVLRDYIYDKTIRFDVIKPENMKRIDKQILHYLEVSITIRDRINKSVNLQLLADQMGYLLGR